MKQIDECRLVKDQINYFDNPSDRLGWVPYYLRIALNVAARSTCLRRKYGAVIVSKDNRIVSTGYNGSASGEENCSDTGVCYREKMGIPHGERYELCVAVHAEANAIMKCNREDLKGATIYIVGIDKDGKLYGEPCKMCDRLIKNSGIEHAVYFKRNEENDSSYIYKMRYERNVTLS